MASCSPPKSTGVKAHARSKPRSSARKAAGGAKRAATAPYVVERNGQVVSRHRTLTAAISERRRRDLASYRAGQGRPYSTRKAG